MVLVGQLRFQLDVEAAAASSYLLLEKECQVPVVQSRFTVDLPLEKVDALILLVVWLRRRRQEETSQYLVAKASQDHRQCESHRTKGAKCLKLRVVGCQAIPEARGGGPKAGSLAECGVESEREAGPCAIGSEG